MRACVRVCDDAFVRVMTCVRVSVVVRADKYSRNCAKLNSVLPSAISSKRRVGSLESISSSIITCLRHSHTRTHTLVSYLYFVWYREYWRHC